MSNYIKYIYVLIILLLYSSCSNDKIDNDGITEIKFWHSFVSSSIPALTKMISIYEESNPNIRIDAQYIPSGDPLVHKLITAIQSGTTPDIAWVHSDFIEKLVKANSIYAMEPFIEGDDGITKNEFNDFFPQLIENGTIGDSLYAMPMEATTLALVYNKTLLKENGINPQIPPQTWMQLKEYVDKLTIDTDNDGKYDQYGFYVPAFPASGPLSVWMLLQWEPFIWQAGGRLINDDQSELLFNDRSGVLALTLWKKLYDRMNFGQFSLSHDMAFASGTVAMVMDGPWNIPLYRKIKNFEWGVSRLPKGPSKEATYLAGEYLTIFKNSRYPQESWRFIKWFTEPKNQAEFSIDSGYLPVRKSSLEIPFYKKYLEENEYMAGFVDQINIAQPKTKINQKKIEINQLISKAIEKVLIGDESPKSALDEAKKLGDNYLGRN